MKKVKTLYEFKHNFYDNLSIAMERKNMNCKTLSEYSAKVEHCSTWTVKVFSFSRNTHLSRAVHKNDGYISRIMSGKIEPSFSMIFYIAEALGIEPRDLL